jgi:glyceraldehyde-3-phosphate dehydrogenase/erythrose-4-phosphate dehydrogenase
LPEITCTISCLAPMVKVLDEVFGIGPGLMRTIHLVKIVGRCDNEWGYSRRPVDLTGLPLGRLRIRTSIR